MRAAYPRGVDSKRAHDPVSERFTRMATPLTQSLSAGL